MPRQISSINLRMRPSNRRWTILCRVRDAFVSAANAVISATASFGHTLKDSTPQAVTIYPIHRAKIRYVGAGCTANERTAVGRGRPGLRGMFSQAWLRYGAS